MGTTVSCPTIASPLLCYPALPSGRISVRAPVLDSLHSVCSLGGIQVCPTTKMWAGMWRSLCSRFSRLGIVRVRAFVCFTASFSLTVHKYIWELLLACLSTVYFSSLVFRLQLLGISLFGVVWCWAAFPCLHPFYAVVIFLLVFTLFRLQVCECVFDRWHMYTQSKHEMSPHCWDLILKAVNSRSRSLSGSLSLFLSVCLCLPACLPVCLCLSVSFSLYLFIKLHLEVPVPDD